MTNYPLPETANDNRLPCPDQPGHDFEHNGDRFELTFFPPDQEGYCDPVDLLDSAEIAEYRRTPRWYRAQLEASVPKPKIILRDTPAIEVIQYVPERSDGVGLIQVASIQPAHLMSEAIERSDILHIDAALAGPEEWRLLLTLPKSIPVIMQVPGGYLEAARQAVAFALDGQKCFWIDLAGADRYWVDRLKRFER